MEKLAWHSYFRKSPTSGTPLKQKFRLWATGIYCWFELPRYMGKVAYTAEHKCAFFKPKYHCENPMQKIWQVLSWSQKSLWPYTPCFPCNYLLLPSGHLLHSSTIFVPINIGSLTDEMQFPLVKPMENFSKEWILESVKEKAVHSSFIISPSFSFPLILTHL